MLYRDICKTLSFYMWILVIPLSIPLFIALYTDWVYPQPPASLAFLYTILITVFLGFIFWFIGRKNAGHLYRREALLLVIIVYFLTPAIWALPFIFNGTLVNPATAYFEAASGLTTTGASIMQSKQYNSKGEEIPYKVSFITGEQTTYTFYGTITPVFDAKEQKYLTGVEAVSPALLFWRSFMQWLGGGGIIVLFVAILPALGVGGKVLFQTEVTGPSKESMVPRIKETASHLWKIYFALTALELMLLMLTNYKVAFFDALTIAFSTISTGGFSIKNAGIAYYDSAFTDWVVIVFMILGSISFSIYFFCMRGKFYKLKDPELRVFLLIILVSTAIATWQLMGKREDLLTPSTTPDKFSFSEALRYGAFQVVSAQTSTGFATANYNIWPFTIQVLMLVLFFVGGMAGSTAGGIKVIRFQTFYRIMMNKIESLYRPDTVRHFRVGLAIIDKQTALTVLCFFMVVASLAILSTFLLVLDGVDPETSLTTIGCMMNNVGLGFRMGGPTESFAFLSDWGKILSSFLMIAGRLEYFALLIAFVPAFWKTSY